MASTIVDTGWGLGVGVGEGGLGVADAAAGKAVEVGAGGWGGSAVAAPEGGAGCDTVEALVGGGLVGLMAGGAAGVGDGVAVVKIAVLDGSGDAVTA